MGNKGICKPKNASTISDDNMPEVKKKKAKPLSKKALKDLKDAEFEIRFRESLDK